MAKPAVFVRPLRVGEPVESGKDVTAIQRALVQANVLKPGAAAQGLYAERTWQAVKRFQTATGVKPLTGNYGKDTHRKLTPFFDRYGRWLLNEAKTDLLEQQAEQQRRERVRQACHFYYSERDDIGYSQARPIPTVYHGIRPPQVPRYLDCSGLAITVYWVAGVLSYLGAQNGAGYGNTWSLARYGVLVKPDELRPADLVFYGSDLGHVAIYVGDGRVVSHGSWPGPLLLPWDYRGVHSCRSYLP
jgi:peptidoglycan hydrolase-like protein with peptidoglycan-binding domain